MIRIRFGVKGRTCRSSAEDKARRSSHGWWLAQSALLGFAAAATAQEQPAMKTIDVEVTEEVKAIRLGRAENPYAEIASRGLAAAPEDNRFLAAIDITKLNPALIGGTETTRTLASEEAVSTLEERTIYDAEGLRATSFETRYDQLNATLRCHWAYDETISSRLAALDAKAKEAELERSFSDEQAGRSLAPDEATEPPKDEDPEFDFVVKERQFKKAGRPCLLTVSCESVKDPKCSDAFLDEVVKSIVLVREGAK